MLKTLTQLPNGKLRIAIASLLTLNAVLYALLDSLVAATDAFAWLALLFSFELETAGLPSSIQEKSLHKFRNALLIIIGLVTLAYLVTGDPLNFANSILWIGLIGLLEMEVRAPTTVENHSKLYWLASVLVFTGLISMVALSFWLGAVLDGFNNMLWIVAFALIEVDLFSFLKFKK